MIHNFSVSYIMIINMFNWVYLILIYLNIAYGSKEKDDENTSDNNEIELPTRIPKLKADKDGFTNNPIFKKKNSNDLFDFEEYSRYKHHEQSRKYKKTFRPSIVFRE